MIVANVSNEYQDYDTLKLVADEIEVMLERQFIMSSISRDENKSSNYVRVVNFAVTIFIISLLFNTNQPVMGQGNTLHYKMISTVEYAGKGQFRNQVETMYTADKETLADGRIKYVISPDESNMEAGQERPLSTFSFIINKETQRMSSIEEDMSFWVDVHNESVKSLRKVSSDYIGRTWRQAIDLSILNDVMPNEINLTLTAIGVKSNNYGDMIAVRSLSEPFFVKITKGFLRARINTVYLFDANIEDVYLSISVFEATTTANGFKESLRHEVATYKTNQSGVPVDLSNIGNDFERLVAKVGLSTSSLEIVKEESLPRWASEKGLRAAQIANICSAAVCEGALNPVPVISMPTVKIVDSQHKKAGAGMSVFERMANGFGWNLPTAAVIGAAIAIPIAASGGGGGGGGGVASPK